MGHCFGKLLSYMQHINTIYAPTHVGFMAHVQLSATLNFIPAPVLIRFQQIDLSIDIFMFVH
jgi:hypothetical protein